MLVFFFPLFENLGSYVYDSMRAYGFVFERHQRSDFFSLRSCTACARVLSLTVDRALCMRLPARAGPLATTAPALSATRRQRRKVDKCRVADKNRPNPVRRLSPASIGQQKSRHENSLLFPHSLPMSRPRASSHQAQTSCSAELPVTCTHFFYALSMIMVGYVGVPCSYQQTLQNMGDHQKLQQLAHNKKTFEVRESSRFQSSENGPEHEAGRLARIIFM